MKMDGRELKEGDSVFSLVYGEGIVQAPNPFVFNKIGVEFENRGMVYYNEHFSSSKYQLRTLFWSEPKFEIPKPPKQKVIKYVVCYKFNNCYHLSGYYKSQADFEKNVNAHHHHFVCLIKQSEKEFLE